MSTTLARLCEEDLTLTWHMEPATRQTLLFGMGDQHIDVAVRRAEQKFQMNMNLLEPKVPYEEHITKEASAMYRHKKQTGGSGQFGEVHLKVFPLRMKTSVSVMTFSAGQSQAAIWLQLKKASVP